MVSDITYIPTAESWLYLAVVIYIYFRKVVGLSINKKMTKKLVIDALNMGIKNRNPKKGLIFHSDRGSQYTRHDCQKDYKTRKQVKQDIFEYIAVYYNRIRMHSMLNYKSPENYENERKLSKLCV
ncbi:integrase-like protein [Halanaerobium sp. MA284_MarDTE_T2]|nr:integrase-like protein [Halanaerobium sp. MA284_MarDTE_T2]